MAFPAAAVANEFLGLAQQDGCDITPLKMQKLVYFAHGWYLALFKRPLLSESIQAWEFGPVVSSLYHEFKPYGGNAITEDAKVGGFYQPHLSDAAFEPDSVNAKAVIKRVWDQYKPYSASQLVSLTHSPDSPWSAVPDRNRRATSIPDDAIRAYFERQLRES